MSCWVRLSIFVVFNCIAILKRFLNQLYFDLDNSLFLPEHQTPECGFYSFTLASDLIEGNL